MPRLWPLLALHFPLDGDPSSVRDRALAIVDDYGPTAIDDEEPVWRIYFDSAADRDRAAAALEMILGPQGVRVEPREQSDEDWARRSQEGLPPVQVGRFLILPSLPDSARGPREESESSSAAARACGGGAPRAGSNVGRLPLVIEPSTGFGTGHHASTRLCLRLLQGLDLRGASVLDVGCGSGILALAAARLGAAHAVGIDIDPDAVDAARRNLALNPEAAHVSFLVADMTGSAWHPPASSAPPREPASASSAAPRDPASASSAAPREIPSASPREPTPASILLGNLTGTFLTRHATALLSWLAPGGFCILSGILAEEEMAVRHAFSALSCVEAAYEDEWVGLLLRNE